MRDIRDDGGYLEALGEVVISAVATAFGAPSEQGRRAKRELAEVINKFVDAEVAAALTRQTEGK